ncbi:hypothetical protein HHK36_025193 [Tetracentron sinense]|uniref:Uncharacterized protein n=1 Tax=Tetracentron sinense TaxID=13715 RepID=A0A834YS80_TETSI|nr:hypothetical protein HHK36_025193 [Tetracentron sinense]
MESNHQSGGFIKSKLGRSKQYSSKVKSSPPSSNASVGFLVDQEFVMSSPKQNAPFINADNNPYGDGEATDDESVNLRATSYISYVQERFKLERVAYDRREYQQMH